MYKKKLPCIACGNLVAEGTTAGHRPYCSLLRQWIGPRRTIVTTVFDLRLQEELVYLLPPRKAVIYAHAQSKDDWDVAKYMSKYGKLIKSRTRKDIPEHKTWFLGDFAAIEWNKKRRKNARAIIANRHL